MQTFLTSIGVLLYPGKINIAELDGTSLALQSYVTATINRSTLVCQLAIYIDFNLTTIAPYLSDIPLPYLFFKVAIARFYRKLLLTLDIENLRAAK